MTANAPDTRARTRKAPPAETEQRVQHIIEMMSLGEWLRGQTITVLAAEWGISESRVKDLSAEAWRRVCATADDAHTIRPTIAGSLMVALERAMAAGRYGDVARLADVWTRIVGARAPEARVEVSLTEEQARARFKELTGREWEPAPP